ncbi:MAG: hypothetical protein K0Q49_1328 [Haloplasmataceae bacterium]|nr:hypothetical protein [Haloplasmataceae bacterium]
MAEKAKKAKRTSDKDVLFRNTVFGTIFSIINFIIICVVYFILFKRPEYRNYLEEGMTIFNHKLDGNEVGLLTFIIAVITPLFFLLRSILLGLFQLLTRRNDFITVMLNIAVNFMVMIIIVIISLVIFFLYNVILSWIFG